MTTLYAASDKLPNDSTSTPFDKSLNNGFLFCCLNIFRFSMAIYKLTFDTSTTQIQ